MKALNRFLMSQRQVTLKDACVQQCLNSQKSGKSNFTLKRAFRVILGHPYGCQQKSRTGFRRNIVYTIMSTLFLKLQRYSKTTHSSISTTPSPQLDESSPSEASKYLQIIYISRKWSHWPTFCR